MYFVIFVFYLFILNMLRILKIKLLNNYIQIKTQVTWFNMINYLLLPIYFAAICTLVWVNFSKSTSLRTTQS